MRNFSNNAVETELEVALDLTSTAMIVKEITGHAPCPTTFLVSPDGALEEIVLATSRSGLTYTVVRGWGNTTPLEHPANSKVRHGAVAEDFREAALAYKLLYGDPVYGPDGVPTNPPLMSPADTVSKADLTWAGLLPDDYVSPIDQGDDA